MKYTYRNYTLYIEKNKKITLICEEIRASRSEGGAAGEKQ